MTRTTPFEVDHFYHVYNRGVDRREIFLDQGDYRRFLLLLYTANSTLEFHLSDLSNWQNPKHFTHDRGETIVDIGAYCLMSNHFHLLLRERMPGGISQFMHKVSTGYTMYFNRKRHRTGSLFGGRFKAEHIAKDDYFMYLYSYIHLNPVSLIEPKWKEQGVRDMHKAKQFLREYPYSSYTDLLGSERAESSLLNPVEFPDYFGRPEVSELADEVDRWLMMRDAAVQDLAENP